MSALSLRESLSADEAHWVTEGTDFALCGRRDRAWLAVTAGTGKGACGACEKELTFRQRLPRLTHWTREGVDRYISQCRAKDEARYALSSVVDELIVERDALQGERDQHMQAARDYAGRIARIHRVLLQMREAFREEPNQGGRVGALTAAIDLVVAPELVDAEQPAAAVMAG